MRANCGDDRRRHAERSGDLRQYRTSGALARRRTRFRRSRARLGHRRGTAQHPQRDLLLLLHRSVGLTILAAVVFRTGWRWHCPPPPLPPAPVRNRSRRPHALCPLPVPYLGAVCRTFERRGGAPRGLLFRGRLNPAAAARNDRLSQVVVAIHLVAQYPLYYSSRSTSRVRCSTAPSDATELSSGWFRNAAPASRFPCSPD